MQQMQGKQACNNFKNGQPKGTFLSCHLLSIILFTQPISHLFCHCCALTFEDIQGQNIPETYFLKHWGIDKKKKRQKKTNTWRTEGFICMYLYAIYLSLPINLVRLYFIFTELAVPCLSTVPIEVVWPLQTHAHYMWLSVTCYLVSSQQLSQHWS